MSAPTAASPGPGAIVDILPRDGRGSRPARAILRASRGFFIDVDVEGGPTFADGADVILAGGAPGERVAVLARFMAQRDGTARFKQMSPWRPVDTRAFDRVPARRQVAIRTVDGTLAASGTTHDVSLGGLAVAVDAPIAETGVEIAFGGDGGTWLPCKVVEAGQQEGATVLHLAFSEAGDAERACIAALVDELSEALELRTAP